MEKGTGAFEILAGKPTRKKPLGWPRRRSEDNIRMDLKELVDPVLDMDYWRALVHAALNLQVRNFMELVI